MNPHQFAALLSRAMFQIDNFVHTVLYCNGKCLNFSCDVSEQSQSPLLARNELRLPLLGNGGKMR